MRARRPQCLSVGGTPLLGGGSNALPPTPNHRPPIGAEERYSTRLALNHRCRSEVIRLSYCSNGAHGSLTQGGNVCGRGAGRPLSCLPILFISALGSFEGFDIGPGAGTLDAFGVCCYHRTFTRPPGAHHRRLRGC